MKSYTLSPNGRWTMGIVKASYAILRQARKDLSIRLQQFFDHYLKGALAPVWITNGLPVIEKGKSWGYETEE